MPPEAADCHKKIIKISAISVENQSTLFLLSLLIANPKSEIQKE
jgi:hypothetical protein